MFVPPRCPDTACPQHLRPTPSFFRRRGFYYPASRQEGVPRFLCKTCKKTFSRQTFRHDNRDRRPDTNAMCFMLLASGVGLRQTARVIEINPRSVQGKKRKMARTFGWLHDNLCPRLPIGRTYLLDEEETYETAAIRPLTMPVLIEKEAWFVVATAVGSIRRLAKAGSRRRELQEAEERDVGARPDQSSECVRQVLTRLAEKAPDGPILLHTDQKASYPPIARQVLGDRLVHETTASTLVRDTHNPLFAVNTTLAMTRDNCGRLRRRSWLVTKKAACLQNHLLIFLVYRNYVRKRFNRDKRTDTPAKVLGLLPRNLQREEVLAWRQDWGDLSIHPMSLDARRTVRDVVPA